MTGRQAAKQIIARLRDQGHVALLAGGCVRDHLLGIEPSDYDVATGATPEQICRIFRRTKTVGAQFGVVLVRMNRVEVEVATFRTDGSYGDGRRPDAVTFSSPEEDARRRDFTVNGMFFDPLAGKVVDYVGGRQDLADRVIRCIGDPRQRFAEDHLRMLRAVRFAARLGFTIELETRAAMIELAPRIADISAERIRMELVMILAHPSRSIGWELICACGLVNHLAAETEWSEADAFRCRQILAALPSTVSEPLGLAAVLAGFDEEQARRTCRNLRCSVAVTRATEQIIAWAMRIVRDELGELADVKFLLASGVYAEAIALACAIARADETDPACVERAAARAGVIRPEDHAPPPLVDGEDLHTLRLPQGPRFREILDALYRAQLNEELTTRAEALARAKQMVSEGG